MTKTAVRRLSQIGLAGAVVLAQLVGVPPAVVTADSPPTAALSLDTSAGAAPLIVNADASGSADTDGTPIATYTFSFGDGSPAVGPQSAPTASHVYTRPGVYPLVLTATDTAGLSAAANATVTVRANLIGNPGFEVDTSGWNTSAGWSVGVTLTRSPVSHLGSYSALLTNTGTGSTSCILNDAPNWIATTVAGTYAARVWVRADQPGATVKLLLREYAGSTLMASVISSTVLTTSWQQLITSFTPVAPGKSTIDYQVYVSNAPPGSCFYADDAAISLSFNTVDVPPVAAVMASPGSGTAPLQISADASQSADADATPIATYTFNFGDGSAQVVQATPLATHTYSLPGSYQVTVTVMDAAGNTAIATTTITASPNAQAHLTLAVIGDYGICAYPPCAHEQAVAAMVHAWQPDDIVTVGDNSYQSGSYAEVPLDQQPYAADVQAGTFYPIAGNHDWDTGSYDPSQQYFGKPPHYVAHLASGLLDLFATDMNGGDADGTSASSRQATQYNQDVAASTATWKITADHQPFYSSGLHGSSLYTHWAINPAIDLFLSGHDHDMEHLVVGGQQFLVDGVGGNELYQDCANGCLPSSVWHQDTQYGALRLTITATTLTAEFIAVSPLSSTGVVMHRLVLLKQGPAVAGGPVALMSAISSATPGATGLSLDASASHDSAGKPVATYNFSFGDGSSTGVQASPTASHMYAGPGSYTVAVTVTDGNGVSTTVSGAVTVDPTEAAPLPALSVTPTLGSVPLTVSADASQSTDADATPIATYAFSFGDGTASGQQTGPQTSHQYLKAGTYKLTVTVADSAGLATTATVPVVVEVPPAAALTVTPGSGTVPLAVTADASASTAGSSAIASYSFDFGDGAAVGPQSGASASHTYSVAGTYTVTATVTDTAGLSAQAVATVTVSKVVDLPPSAALTTNPWTGVAPLSILIDASGSTDNDATPIAGFQFNFGDGSPLVSQTAPTVQHLYASPGVYPITVTVTDTAGLSSSATVRLTVMTNLVGNPGFETGLTGWNSPSAGVTITQVSGGHSGSYAAQLTNTGSAGAECTLNDSPNWIKTTASGQYHATLWVRADSAGSLIKLKLREYSTTTGALLGSSTNSIFLSTSWQQINVFYVPVAPGASTLDFQADVPNAPSGVCFYADDAAITLS